MFVIVVEIVSVAKSVSENNFSRVRCLSPGMANQWAIPAGEFVRGLCRRRRGNGGVESQHKSARKRGRCQFGYPSTPMGVFSPE